MTDTCASITTVQLTEITLGLRHDFDWKELFTAVATAGLNQGLNQAGLNADNVDQFNKPTGTKNILNNTVQGGLDSVATSLLYTGNVDTDNLLIQLSGTAVGTKVGNSLFNAFAPTPEQMAAATKPSQKNDQDSKNPINSPDQNQDLPAARKTLQTAQERQKQLNQYKADANQRYEDAQKGRTSVNEVANRTNSKVQTTKGSNSMNGKSRLQASKLSMSPQDIQSNSSRINASGINDFNAGASGFNDALQLKGRSLEGTTLLQKFGYFAGATVGLAAGVITGEAEAVLLVRGIEYVQGMGATTSVVKGASEQLGRMGIFSGNKSLADSISMRDRVNTNIDISRTARDSSNFDTFSRKATAIVFYAQNGFNTDQAAAHMRGIDFAKPVEVSTLGTGTEVVQYMLPNKPVGNYFAPIDVSGSQLGIYTSGRSAVTFFANQDVNVLKSIAAPMVDDYSMAQYGWKIETHGGGMQYFSPNKSVWEMKL